MTAFIDLNGNYVGGGAVTGESPLQIRTSNDLIYSSLLASATRSVQHLWDQDFGLSQDANLYQKMRRDAVIRSLIDAVAFEVAGPEYTVDAQDEDDEAEALLANVCNDALEQIVGFDDSRLILADAPIWGARYAFVEGEERTLSLGGKEQPSMRWWVPTNLVDVDKRRFRYYTVAPERGRADSKVPDGGGRIPMALHLYSLRQNQYVPLTREQARRFVKYVFHKTEDRLGYGEGLADSAYVYYALKTAILEKGMGGLDRWAHGALIITMDALRALSMGADPATVATSAQTAAENMRAGNTYVIESGQPGKTLGDSIQLMESTGTGHKMVMEFLQYIDNALSRLFAGAVRPLGGDKSTGGYAEAKVEEGTINRKMVFFRKAIDTSISRDLLGLFIERNRLNLIRLGLAGAKPPRFRSLDPEGGNTNDKIDRAIKIKGAVPVPKKWLYKQLGAPMPEEGEETIGGETVSPFGPGMGGGFGGKNPFEGEFDRGEREQAA